jgi:hypothetical protein
VKRLAILGIVLAALTLALVLPAQAAITNNESVPYDAVVFVPCANGGLGEDVHLTGYLHMTNSVTNDGHGGFHVTWQTNPQGVTGVGLTTGDKYQGTGVTRSNTNAKPPFPYETTFVNNFRIIGQGPGNNFLVHQVMHMTVDANGNVVVNFDKSSTECK